MTPPGASALSASRMVVARVIFSLIRKWRLVFPLSPSSDPSIAAVNSDYDRSYGLSYEIMACDETRNRAYKHAIEAAVTGKTVIDAGAGALALWGKEAVENRAAAVVCIEANPRSYDRARQELARRGMTGVALLNQLSTDVALSDIGGERYEVLIQELIGNIGSEEGAAHSVSDLRTRLLKPDAKLIPASVTTFFSLVSEPELSHWDRAVNKCLGGLGSFPQVGYYGVYDFPRQCHLSSPAVLEELDFTHDIDWVQERDHAFSLERNGEWAGILMWIRIVVDPSNVVDSLASKTNWALVYLKCAERCVHLTTRDRIHVKTVVDLREPAPDYQISLDVRDPDDAPIHSSSFRWKGALYPSRPEV